MRPMKHLTLALAFSLSLCLLACDSGSDEKKDAGKDKDEPSTTSKILNSGESAAAQKAVEQMLVIAKAGDWSTLVDSYFAGDLASGTDKKQVIAMLESSLGEQRIAQFEKAKGVRPVIKGDTAVFEVDGKEVLKLKKTGKGKWGFTL